ncbi:MAG: hydroxymethylbilane synthase [Alitiscatomonas sp.]
MNKEKKVIRLGTRKSPLAMAQARLAAEAIERAFPELTAELVPIMTRGDRILDRPLVEFGGKGAFISVFERTLLEGRIDGAVHSAKDMPEELAKGLVIAAALPREDAGDVLVTVKGRPLPDGPLLVGTGSPRRQVQIGEMRNARCALLRGNIQTRLNKLREGEYDAILLAAAGLKRMGLFRPGVFERPLETTPAEARDHRMESRGAYGIFHGLRPSTIQPPSGPGGERV